MSKSSRKKPQNQMKKVLIVEDIPESMLILMAVVIEIGVEAYPAPDGEDALSLLNEGLRPDLILLDLRMPRVNGIRFYNSMRAISGCSKIPVILTSSDDLAPDLAVALNLFGHANKSTSRGSLQSMIKSALK